MNRHDGERPIALIGLMGAGQSAVARVLGERLGVSVADLDGMIEAVGGHSASVRPLLAGKPARERLAQLLAERAPLYAEAAHARVATDGKSPEQVADAVIAAVGK